MGISNEERPRSDRGSGPHRDDRREDRRFDKPQRFSNDFRSGPPRDNGYRSGGRSGDRSTAGFGRSGGGFGRPGGPRPAGADRFGRDGRGGAGARFGGRPSFRPFQEEEEEENRRPDTQVDFVINAEGISTRDDEPPQRNKKKKKKKRIRIFLNPWLSRMKLPKLLTKLRYLSPRLARQFVESGRVRINSRPVTSERYEVNLRKERVTIDEAPCEFPRRCQYMVLNKPRGMVCQPGDPAFDELVTPGQQWAFPFGRLDRAASGIVIMSNDPRMARMQHRLDEEFHKQYRVLLNSPLNEEELRELSLGVRVGDEYFIPLRVERVETGGKRMWIDITLLDDTPTSIHRAFKALGREIVKLRRVRIGSIDENTIPYGEWRELSSYEISALDLKRFLPGELPPEPDPSPFEYFERPPFLRRPGSGRPGGPPPRGGRPAGRPSGRFDRGRDERGREGGARQGGPRGDMPRNGAPRREGDRREGAGPRGEWVDRREQRPDGQRFGPPRGSGGAERPRGDDRGGSGERGFGRDRGGERQGGERPRPVDGPSRDHAHRGGAPGRDHSGRPPRNDSRNEQRDDRGGRSFGGHSRDQRRDARYEGMRRSAESTFPPRDRFPRTDGDDGRETPPQRPDEV